MATIESIPLTPGTVLMVEVEPADLRNFGDTVTLGSADAGGFVDLEVVGRAPGVTPGRRAVVLCVPEPVDDAQAPPATEDTAE